MVNDQALMSLRRAVGYQYQDELNALIVEATGPGNVAPSATAKLAVFAAPAGLWVGAMGCIAVAVKWSSLAVAIVGWSTGALLAIGALVLLAKRATGVADDGWGAYVPPRTCRACGRLAEENARLRDALTAPETTP